MAIPGSLLGAPKLQLFDSAGDPVAGGKLYAYAAGTSTPQNTYTDVDLTTANANPVILDSAGRATVFLSPAAYKFTLKTSADVELWTQDDVEDIGQTLFSSLGIDVGAPFGPPTTRTLTSGGTLTLTDQLILANSTGGPNPCIINLPPAATCEQPWIVIKQIGTVPLAVTPNGTDLVDLVAGAYTVPIAVPPLYPSVILMANGSSWYVVGAVGI
jgi:hypothetical protein